MVSTEAYVCKEKGGKLALEVIPLNGGQDLKATEVELEMKYCGLCHTDIHMRDNDWGVSDFPVVLGHEGIGTVSAKGECVRDLNVGDTVGVTWIRDSCQSCHRCKEGRENICEEGYLGTYLGPSAGCWGSKGSNTMNGCFSKKMRIESKFAVKVPPDTAPEIVYPLLCGGGTVFEPIADYVKPGMNVAVASIGGLGTAAIKFASVYGANVTALSRGDSKKTKALAVGADLFYGCLGDKEKMQALSGRFDLIIDTCPVNSDIKLMMSMLQFNGTYCRVGIPSSGDMALTYDYIPLIFSQKKIVGSVVTGTKRMQEMIDLVRKLPPDTSSWGVKVVPFAKINEVMEELKEGKNQTNWRYVLKW